MKAVPPTSLDKLFRHYSLFLFYTSDHRFLQNLRIFILFWITYLYGITSKKSDCGHTLYWPNTVCCLCILPFVEQNDRLLSLWLAIYSQISTYSCDNHLWVGVRHYKSVFFFYWITFLPINMSLKNYSVQFSEVRWIQAQILRNISCPKGFSVITYSKISYNWPLQFHEATENSLNSMSEWCCRQVLHCWACYMNGHHK